MATLKLSTEQAEYVAKRLTWKFQGVTEEKLGTFSDADAADVLAAWDEMASLVEAIRDLSEEQQTTNLDLVADIVSDALDDHRGSVGYVLTIQRCIEAGEVVQWLADKGESADDAIERQKEAADEEVALACLAWSIVEAIGRVQDEAKAAGGDARAKESLAITQRWAEENRKLAAERAEAVA